MQKTLYYIFLMAALTAFICTLVTNIGYSKLYLVLGDNYFFHAWFDPGFWGWLIIAILLIVSKQWAIVPLVLLTYDSASFGLSVIHNAWNNEIYMACNILAGYAALIMLVTGYLYYISFFIGRFIEWYKKPACK